MPDANAVVCHEQTCGDTVQAVQLRRAESLPKSPAESTSSEKSGSHIYIDKHGIHDFDFKNRHSHESRRRLKKLSRRNISSISSMTDLEQLSSSASDQSLRKRFTTLLAGHASIDRTPTDQQDNKKCNHLPDNIKNHHCEPEDPIPDTKKDLEIRLNYHLSELDILKKTIRAANDVVLQHQERYQILDTRSTADMQESMKRQGQLVQLARANRNAYAGFVGYHRRQIERIKHKRIDIELAAGLEPTLPEVYKSMWNDDDWGLLFKV